MKTLITIASLLASTAAYAHDYNRDINCQMTDKSGNTINWYFAVNTKDASGRSGSFVETGFKKNGAVTVSPSGQRPVWMWWSNQQRGTTFASQRDPAYMIATANETTVNGYLGGPATLFKNNVAQAQGVCAINTIDTNVGDVAAD